MELTETAIKQMSWKDLKNKKIKVTPVERRGSWLSIINNKHDGAFMYSRTIARYCLPTNRMTRQLVDPFASEEDREEIEKALSFNKGDLSIHKRENNFWKSYEVKLTKDGLALNLASPTDYLVYITLLANSETIAPNWDERFEKGTYRFALVDVDMEIRERAKKATTTKDAYKKLGQMESSPSTMMNFLTVYGRKPASNSSREFLISELDKIIEEDIQGFFAVANDNDFEMKLLISRGVDIKAIIKPTKTRYELPGGDLIGNTLNEAVEYFKNPANQENYLVLKARVETND